MSGFLSEEALGVESPLNINGYVDHCLLASERLMIF